MTFSPGRRITSAWNGNLLAGRPVSSPRTAHSLKTSPSRATIACVRFWVMMWFPLLPWLVRFAIGYDLWGDPGGHVSHTWLASQAVASIVGLALVSWAVLRHREHPWVRAAIDAFGMKALAVARQDLDEVEAMVAEYSR